MKTSLGLRRLFWYTSVLVFKSYNIPSLCYNYYNPETSYQQEFIRPPGVPTVYQVIPRRCFVYFSGICDILTARLMGSERYLLLSMFLPADAISLENLLLVLMERGHRSLCGMLLAHMSIFYIPLLTDEHLHVVSYMYPAYRKSYNESHKISLNISWFLHLNMFEQYSRYFHDILYAVFVYLLNMVPREQRMEIVLLFKPSNYKSYLLHVADSPLFHLYLLVFVLESYIQHLFRTSGTGNPNFVNWCSMAFVGMFVLERRWKILKSSACGIHDVH